MKITILTLFDDLFESFLKTSIIGKAIKNNLVDIEVVNFRKFSLEKHQKVDDVSYGGGSGMVLMLQPIIDALKHYKTKDSKTILLTPSGSIYNQVIANHFKRYEHLILICGHYEGFDERILNYIDFQISIGDYILTGGEIPAMVLVESIVRLIPNVIKQESVLNESFESGLLDYPVYTKPRVYDGYKVPDVLLSGDHQRINQYRLEQSIKKTKNNRIDLYNKWKEFNKVK